MLLNYYQFKNNNPLYHQNFEVINVIILLILILDLFHKTFILLEVIICYSFREEVKRTHHQKQQSQSNGHNGVFPLPFYPIFSSSAEYIGKPSSVNFLPDYLSFSNSFLIYSSYSLDYYFLSFLLSFNYSSIYLNSSSLILIST